MTITKKLLAGIALILMSPVIVVVLWISYAVGHGLLLKAIGYDVDIDPKELAVLIYENHESVKRCSNLMQAVPTMGPTIGDKRMRCIYEYASLAKDPSACELLMPSSYGWSCIGGAKDEEPCGFGTYAEPKVTGNGIAATLEECETGQEKIQSNACCIIARIKYRQHEDNCSLLKKQPALMDQCHHEIALKNKNLTRCVLIKNSNIRSACNVQVRALLSETEALH